MCGAGPGNPALARGPSHFRTCRGSAGCAEKARPLIERRSAFSSLERLAPEANMMKGDRREVLTATTIERHGRFGAVGAKGRRSTGTWRSSVLTKACSIQGIRNYGRQDRRESYQNAGMACRLP